MNAEELLNSIVEEVLKRLRSKMKKATVLFTGGAYGSSEAQEQIRLLLEDGWDLNILLSNSAEYVLTPQLIREKLSISKVYVEKDIKGLSPFYQGVSALIVPTLTLNTAVKISLGIADTMATNLVSHCIMQGIPIIAAKDGCDLQNPVRAQLGLDKSPKAYLDKMIGHLQTIETYGVKLVDVKDLYAAVQKNVFSFPQQVKKGKNPSQQIYDFKKKVLTRVDIVEAKRNERILKVPHTTILSPLALEAAKEFGVQIIQE